MQPAEAIGETIGIVVRERTGELRHEIGQLHDDLHLLEDELLTWAADTARKDDLQSLRLEFEQLRREAVEERLALVQVVHDLERRAIALMASLAAAEPPRIVEAAPRSLSADEQEAIVQSVLERIQVPISIEAIEQPEPDSALVHLTDGRSFALALPRGPAGEDGRFKPPVRWRGEGQHQRGELVTKDGGLCWVGDDDHLVPIAVGVRTARLIARTHRDHVLEIELSDGTSRRFDLYLPVPWHRGLYDPEMAYEQGDEVAWNGSLWRCIVPSQGSEPPSRDWLLAAKQGKHGRPGTPGDPGTGITRVWKQDNALMFDLADGNTQSIEMPE